MDDGDDERFEVIQSLFALATSLCEDAATIGLTGQSCSNPDELSRLAALLAEAGQRVTIVANAVLAIPLPRSPN
jgi:hypothetical protein